MSQKIKNWLVRQLYLLADMLAAPEAVEMRDSLMVMHESFNQYENGKWEGKARYHQNEATRLLGFIVMNTLADAPNYVTMDIMTQCEGKRFCVTAQRVGLDYKTPAVEINELRRRIKELEAS